MALNVILICLVGVTTLNTVLIVDLNNRSKKFAQWVNEQHEAKLLRRLP